MSLIGLVFVLCVATYGAALYVTYWPSPLPALAALVAFVLLRRADRKERL